MTAVVPVYRCGAAPVSHRVPSCRSSLSGAPTQRGAQRTADFMVSQTGGSASYQWLGTPTPCPLADEGGHVECARREPIFEAMVDCEVESF